MSIDENYQLDHPSTNEEELNMFMSHSTEDIDNLLLKPDRLYIIFFSRGIDTSTHLESILNQILKSIFCIYDK